MDENSIAKIKAWRADSGLNFIMAPEKDPLEEALKAGAELADAEPKEIDEVLLTLVNYHIYLSSEMGRFYSIMVDDGNTIARSKLNQVKPVVEAVKVKIDALKKIYDRRIREIQAKNKGE